MVKDNAKKQVALLLADGFEEGEAVIVLDILERLADLIDVRKDDLGLALSNERLPQRGKSFATRIRKQKAKSDPTRALDDVVDPDGASF